MFVPKKVRYAVRSFIELSIIHTTSGNPVQANAVSKNQGISKQFLANIFHIMTRAGLLKGIKGRAGGFIPARPIKNISILDIYRAFEEPFGKISCTAEKNCCPRSQMCPASEFWNTTAELMKNHMAATSVQDIVKKTIEKMPKQKIRALSKKSL